MDNQKLKFAAGALMFVTWVALVAFRVPNTDELIAFIKYALVGLGAHIATPQKVTT